MNLNCAKCGKRPGERVYCDSWECPELDWDIIANAPRQAPEPALSQVEVDFYGKWGMTPQEHLANRAQKSSS